MNETILMALLGSDDRDVFLAFADQVDDRAVLAYGAMALADEALVRRLAAGCESIDLAAVVKDLPEDTLHVLDASDPVIAEALCRRPHLPASVAANLVDCVLSMTGASRWRCLGLLGHLLTPEAMRDLALGDVAAAAGTFPGAAAVLAITSIDDTGDLPVEAAAALAAMCCRYASSDRLSDDSERRRAELESLAQFRDVLFGLASHPVALRRFLAACGDVSGSPRRAEAALMKALGGLRFLDARVLLAIDQRLFDLVTFVPGVTLPDDMLPLVVGSTSAGASAVLAAMDPQCSRWRKYVDLLVERGEEDRVTTGLLSWMVSNRADDTVALSAVETFVAARMFKAAGYLCSYVTRCDRLRSIALRCAELLSSSCGDAPVGAAALRPAFLCAPEVPWGELLCEQDVVELAAVEFSHCGMTGPLRPVLESLPPLIKKEVVSKTSWAPPHPDNILWLADVSGLLVEHGDLVAPWLPVFFKEHVRPSSLTTAVSLVDGWRGSLHELAQVADNMSNS